MQSSVISILVGLTIFVSCSIAERKHWAVLIAGSNNYVNYRHQADVCHAYQILHKNGIPDEQIIVMMFDDIANNSLNPVKGNIINRPGGPNVYPGVPKDYTGNDVTADNFLKVLQGDQDGIKKALGRKGKVLNTGPEDYVFVYYADHGAPEFLGMPNPPYLRANILNNVLRKMAKDKKFAKLTFYVEACESGSMFVGRLASDTNIYATTAANPHEYSWACYCDNDRNVCLGDLYSVSWLENTDMADIHKETLEEQYEKVKIRTNMSHVMQYGDLNFTSYTLDKFFANQEVAPIASIVSSVRSVGKMVPSVFAGIHSLRSMLASNDAFFISRRAEIQAKLERQLSIQEQTSQVVREIATRVLGHGTDVSAVLEQRSEIRNLDCYEKAVDQLFEMCPGLNPHVNDFIFSKLFTLVNLCNVRGPKVVAVVKQVAMSAAICK